MQSDRRNRFTKTFSFRLAMLHILLVSIALAATFALAILLLRIHAETTGRKQLESALRHAQGAYLSDKAVPTEPVQLPQKLLEKIEERFPGIHIGMVEQEQQPGGAMFEVLGSTGQEWLEILAEPSGRIWVADRKSLQEVFGWLKESVRETNLDRFNLFILSGEGTLLAGNPAALPTPFSESFEGKPQTWKDGSLRIGAVRLYDGNQLYLTHPANEALLLTRYGIGLFLLTLGIFIPMAGGIGYHIAQRAMDGVRRVTAATERVKAGNFSERVPAGTEGSEIEELTAAFNEMVDRIETLMREMREVTVNIAHDLRSPIARIRGMLESMEWSETPSTSRNEQIGKALEECDHIAPLIDSILELAQAETGMLVLQNDAFDLAKEVRAAHALFSSVSEDRKIQFNCSLPTEPVRMNGDRVRMQRILVNLLDNALKFTAGNGTVSIALKSDGKQATLSVQDNGCGMAEADLERVFERFYRVDRSRNLPGNGLGLSLVKAFVQALGGTVEIDSAKGAGCTVRVQIPLTFHIAR